MNEINLDSVAGVAVYSAVTSGYDVVLPPIHVDPSFEYVLLSDEALRVSVWRRASMVKNFSNPVLTNRYHKFFPHLVMPNAEYSIYVDGNIGIIGDLGKLLRSFVDSGAAIGIFRHPSRETIFQEVDACINTGKFDDEDVLKAGEQIRFILDSGMPPARPLTDNAVLFRWHKHPAIENAMEQWWEHIHTYTKRDQISLPYILWKNNVPVKYWDWSIREENEFFQHYRHKRSRIHAVRIRLRHMTHRSRLTKTAYDFLELSVGRIRSRDRS